MPACLLHSTSPRSVVFAAPISDADAALSIECKQGDIETLQRLFARPYSDDHDPRLVEKYARRAPDGTHTQGGVGYMS